VHCCLLVKAKRLVGTGLLALPLLCVVKRLCFMVTRDPKVSTSRCSCCCKGDCALSLLLWQFMVRVQPGGFQMVALQANSLTTLQQALALLP
jgi:hypothetical protein